MDKPKYCYQCRWYRLSLQKKKHRCTHQSALNDEKVKMNVRIQGIGIRRENVNISCKKARENQRKFCGKAAQYFEVHRWYEQEYNQANDD